MGGFTSAPYFSTRVPMQFIAQDAPSLSITPGNSNLLLNNCQIFNVNTGSPVLTNQGVDGLNYLQGDGEYAPFTLDLIWKQIGYNDYLKLAALRPYYIDLVTYRNIAYYGKLVCEGPKSTGPKVSDVLALHATFYPLAPSDQGGAASVARLPTPGALTVVNSNAAATGNIPASLTTYYWITFGSKYGETLPYAAGGTTNSHAGTNNTVSWTWPTSAFCEKASIYVSNANTASSSRLLYEVPNGLAATIIDYVGFQGTLINRQPPAASVAYRGQWCAGIWQNETP